MQDFLKSFQVTMRLDETERAMLTRMLNSVMVSTILIVLIILPFTYRITFSSPISIALILSVVTVNLIGRQLLKRGYLILTSAWLIGCYWALVLVFVISDGGIKSSWLVVQVAIVALAGLVLAGWGGIFMAGLTLIADWVIYRSQSGPIVSGQLGLLENWLALFASLALVSLGVLFAGSLLQTFLRQSRANERLFRSLFDKTNDGVITVGLDLKIVAVNQKAADSLGYEVRELIGKPYEELIPQDERAAAAGNFGELATREMTPLFDRTFVRKDGSRFQVEFNAATVRDENGKLLYFQGVARDVTERKRVEEQLHHALHTMETLAMEDPLTGLLNRRALRDHAEAEWHRARREGKPLSAMLIDIDNLKKANDSKGHEMGDRVIMELAKTIQSSKRPYDWVGRWGGDEFLVVLPGANLEEAKTVAERVCKRYAEINWIRELGGVAMASLGIACFSGRKEDETNLDELISQADKALYQAKTKGKNRVEVYRN